jgi:hypothetical protein
MIRRAVILPDLEVTLPVRGLSVIARSSHRFSFSKMASVRFLTENRQAARLISDGLLG